MTPLLIDISLAFGVINLLIAGLVVGNRFIVRARQRRHDDALQRLRPVLLDWIGGDTDTIPPPAARPEREALIELLAKYGRSLTGEGRKRVTDLATRLHLVGDLVYDTASFSAWKRARAAFRLGDLGDAQQWRLITLLSDRDRRVRNAAARSLGKQGSVEAVAPIVLALSDGRVARAVGGQALLDIGPVAATSLAALMDSDTTEVREAAAELLGRIGTIEHSRILAEHLADLAPTVRVSVVRALGRLGGRSVSETVPALLDDDVPFVRAAAATTLAAIGSTAHIPVLLELVEDPEYLPARAAALALAEMDPDLARTESERTANPHLVEAADLWAASR